MRLKGVLSLFDGISCGQLALRNVGIDYDSYYSSEIDVASNRLIKEKYPETHQLGDVNGWKEWNLENIELILAGSPCQGFSCAGNQYNFEDERSKLFFTFVEILNHYKPKYFLLENVKMKEEWVNIINEYVGVHPIEINSSLVSAQERNRLYWMNWECNQPVDKGINLEDILTSHHNWNSAAIRGRRLDPITMKRKDHDYTIPQRQCIEVRKKSHKSPCITTLDKNTIITRFTEGRHPDAYTKLQKGVDWRKLTMKELERLQTLPDDYTQGFPKSSRQRMIGNGWNVKTIEHIFRELKRCEMSKVNKGSTTQD